ncbi:D-alanyl-D-alanine carboxypeptidase family protein [Gracilibacillus sp. S3-1-1]|uniref:D-alanyl-D-alanine carboxypeptidase family protein n=1 Tax=Gracilibacillus pellucidus TaxID=3095368 RepID=A0ACC6M7R0_9BACI|nr:D-alanyl-D-alanine carboxypeptidase family protein [Gracilibacillus sp. S3-1-1]MDX8046867.1 D-alanyl-D-alanine carboxypeptidase family protein [Gracilibacillus sp. S3-1-1]
MSAQTSPHSQKIKKELTFPTKPLDRFWHIDGVELEANSVMLMNAETGHVIYEKNSDKALPTASMSKMMTELLVLEAIASGTIDWDSEVEISDYAYHISHQPGFASVDLSKDTSYTVRELFEAMAIHSANGAAIALAETVSNSEKLFVAKMNERAAQLDLRDSSFVNSTGLDNKDLDEYYSVGNVEDANKMSAHDLAWLAKYLVDTFPGLLQVIEQPSYQANGHSYPNTNWMLDGEFAFDGVDGLKTGYTDIAGYGFTGTVERDGVRLISVVMGTSSMTERFTETTELYEEAFDWDDKDNKEKHNAT